MVELKNIKNSIKLVSDQSEVFTSFRGPIFQYPIVKSIDRNNGVLRRWIVFSNGKRSVLVKYLYGKWLWDELNVQERLLFFSLKEVTEDLTIYLSLKAQILGVSKVTLRERLRRNKWFSELRYISRQSYLSVKGRTFYLLKEEEIILRRTPKYSGYTRHYKDKGHIGNRRDITISELTEPFVDVNYDIILHYLTVGEISLFGGVIFRPDEDIKSPKRSK